ncbi:MAG: DUF4468 domain-containing protein [Dysgonamonadaceae bacterium]|jgi:flavin reductase (DIM6/NTAB) family NADH-FMN oxidoreductase RutF|nr:DUF4468 domain-containing protein [Dysgonamonadaceae bacterium]
MKKRVLFLMIAFCSNLLGWSSMAADIDPKYLAGAVPEVDGKVVFADTLSFPDTKAASLYETLLQWAKTNYNSEVSRVVYTDTEQAVISCRCKSELVFSSSAFSLDRAYMNYQLNLFALDNSCIVEMKSINYDYNVSGKKEPEKYLAEKWITDKEAVNGKKLYRINGKFRIKTIDLFDDIRNSISLSVLTGETDLLTEKNVSKATANKSAASSERVPAQTKPATTTATIKEPATLLKAETPTPPVNTAPPIGAATSTEMQGYKQMDPEKIPGNIIKLVSNDWMLITAGDDTKFNMMTASWGGLGFLYNKPVAFCFINPARYTYQLMESGDTYTLSFYTEAYRDVLRLCGSTSGSNTDKVKASGLTPITLPSGSKSFSEAWMIIECKKLVSQQFQAEQVNDQAIRDQWSKTQFHKMYIGEILSVWVK